MPDELFQSSRLKVERAKSHINELESIIQDYRSSNFYRLVPEVNTDTRRAKISFETLSYPPTSLNLVFGDVVQNLRSALDHAAYAVVLDSNGAADDTHFPFDETLRELKARIKNGPISAAGQEIADLILNKIKPYKAGNYPLWSLNRLNRIDKHRILIAVTAMRGITISMMVGGVPMLENTVSTSTGNDFIIIETGHDIKIIDEPRPSFEINIGETDLLEGYPLIPTLHNFTEIVQGAVDAFDAVYVRKG